MPITLDFTPRLMPAPQAAHYLGISVGTLRSLQIPRKILGAKRLYDRHDLDRYASELPAEGEEGGVCWSPEEILARLDAGRDERKAKGPRQWKNMGASHSRQTR